MTETFQYSAYNQEQIDRIQYESERNVVNFLLSLNKSLEITYEPRKYTISPEVAAREKIRKRATIPDFEVKNPETGEVILLEVTEQRSASCKSKQRKIMEHFALGIP